MATYYTATGAPAAATKGLSASIRAEFELIETAFAMLSPAGGTAVSIPYTFSTTTAVADPGAGTLRLDNATQNAATAILADLADANAVDVTNILALFDDSTSTVKGFIKLTKLGDSSAFLLFSVSAMTTPSGYRNITVSNVAYSAASPFADGDDILLDFGRNGDAGSPGAFATQSEVEAASSAVTVLSPANVNWHPGVAKAWIKCNAAGAIAASHNVTSITDGGTGLVTVTLATDFSSANYAVLATAYGDQMFVSVKETTQAAGSFQLYCYASGVGAADPTAYFAACYGDQA